jgi:DNA-binding transcriptional ArsR family regulator
MLNYLLSSLSLTNYKGDGDLMLEQFTISDIKQLKALSHASRVKILSSLAEKPMTAKQLADQFGEEPAKTSYHVKQLLKVGLVELKFTRETQNGIIEKYYQAIAKEFQTDPYLARQPEGRNHLETGFLRELNKTQSEFLRAYRSDLEREAGEPTTAHAFHRLNLAAEQLPSFVAELQKLIAKYEDNEGGFAFHYLAFPSDEKKPLA